MTNLIIYKLWSWPYDKKRLWVYNITVEEVPTVNYSIDIAKNMHYKLYCGTSELDRCNLCSDFPDMITSASMFNDLYEELGHYFTSITRQKIYVDVITHTLDLITTNEDNAKKIDFIKEQVKLLVQINKGRRYSNNMLALGVMWHSYSPNLYRRILKDNVLTLPSVRRIYQLTSSLTVDFELTESTLSYLEAKILKLTEKDKIVNLILDEVYVSKQVSFQNGRFYGNENGEITKTLLCIMIQSVAGKYNDVIVLKPISNLTHKIQYEIWYKVIKKLISLGFYVNATLVDGNNVNHSFFTTSICKGKIKPSIMCPGAEERLHFLMFDNVHIFKCVYNNFLNKKLFIYPSWDNHTKFLTADFGDIQFLFHEIEKDSPIKIAHKLTHKVMQPTSIEKTNVSLADSLIHPSTINALMYYSKKGYPSFHETAQFLQIIREWFNRINVKNKYAEQKMNDPSRAAITPDNLTSATQYFNKLHSWLLAWRDSKKDGLTVMTFKTMIQSTSVIPSMMQSLLDMPCVS